MTSELQAKMVAIQTELNCPKNQFNSFGKYKYRSCEDILEGLKPHLAKHGVVLTVSDSMEALGDRIYVKAKATISLGEQAMSATGWAREPLTKKGMDDSQVTGAASSYARKYALNGLFCIDDNKDADSQEPPGNDQQRQQQGRPQGNQNQRQGPPPQQGQQGQQQNQRQGQPRNQQQGAQRQQNQAVDNVQNAFLGSQVTGHGKLAQAGQVQRVNIICTNELGHKDRATRIKYINNWLMGKFPNHPHIDSTKHLTFDAASAFIQAGGR
ncbi:ERF family protein [Maridesulfovibrio sp.]|uniref:ERF family protein n=1 Tax=Maridesulfovibrio sp. TaxID=2795000 RepID=UPI002AA7BB5E|nr:ERF family protein [Maridesulfovibrio sp.]